MNDDVTQVPSTELPGPVTVGETLPHDTEAQWLFKGLQTSNELLLWKKWSRKSSEDPEQFVNCAATSPAGRRRSAVKPPSPLDTGVSSLEIQSWMKEAEWNSRRRRARGSCLSLSSEEGIYSLSALESENEEEGEASSNGPDPSR